jgi:hypothetical protein
MVIIGVYYFIDSRTECPSAVVTTLLKMKSKEPIDSLYAWLKLTGLSIFRGLAERRNGIPRVRVGER